MSQHLPVIPTSEYPLRWAQVQQVMQRRQLDALIAYSDDRACHGNAYARYYANVPAHFEEVLLLFVRDAEPVMMTGPETVCYAGEIGTFPHIEALSEFADPAEDYPDIALTPLQEVIRRYAGGPLGRIGIAGERNIGAQLCEALRQACPQAQFLSADDDLQTLRSIKSAAEIAVIRYAYHIASLGMKAAYDAIRPHVTERDIVAEAEYVMRKAGAEGYGIDPIVASGPNTRHILARTTMREIGEDDAVIVTLAPRYEGYHGACGRTVIVGNPGERTVSSIETGIRAQETCAANLLSGRIGSEVEQIGRNIMKDAGYKNNFLYSGLHSVGVEEFEPPILGPSSKTMLSRNMVVSIDIPLFEAECVLGSRTEDGYLITDAGPERLTEVELLLRK